MSVTRSSMVSKALKGLAVLLCSAPAFAHHSQTMFDQTKTVTLQGVVTKFAWINPHTQLYFDVMTGANAGNWQMELNSALSMSRAGWTRTQYKAGDAVKVTFNPARNGSHYGYLLKVVGPDGKEYQIAGNPPPPGADSPKGAQNDTPSH